MARKVVKENGQSAKAQTVLGKVLLLSKQYAEAKSVLKRAVALDPKSSFAHWYLGYCLESTGELEAAQKEHEAWLKLVAKGNACCGMAKGFKK